MSIESYKKIAKAPAKVLPQVLDLFSITAAQVCEGQQYDMDFEEMKNVPMEDYLKMIGLKTAVLIACAAKMGALIADADTNTCDSLYRFGYDLGLAFQIADDWLDTFGDSKVFGKAIGGDIINNKKTWLMIKALEKSATTGSSEALHEAMQMSIETESERAAKIEKVKSIYLSLGVEEDAKQEILRLHSQAMEYARSLKLSDENYGLLQGYAETLLGRSK